MWKTGCTVSKYQVIHALNPRTKSHTISEVNNILYGTSGSVELNLTFDMNTQELALKFHYRDQDWLFIKQQASIMFIFDDGDIISLSHLGKIHANVTKDGPRPEIIEEWGVVILGTAIVVIVPTLAALAERKWGQKTTTPVTDSESNAND